MHIDYIFDVRIRTILLPSMQDRQSQNVGPHKLPRLTFSSTLAGRALPPGGKLQARREPWRSGRGGSLLLGGFRPWRSAVSRCARRSQTWRSTPASSPPSSFSKGRRRRGEAVRASPWLPAPLGPPAVQGEWGRAVAVSGRGCEGGGCGVGSPARRGACQRSAPGSRAPAQRWLPGGADRRCAFIFLRHSLQQEKAQEQEKEKGRGCRRAAWYRWWAAFWELCDFVAAVGDSRSGKDCYRTLKTQCFKCPMFRFIVTCIITMFVS